MYKKLCGLLAGSVLAVSSSNAQAVVALSDFGINIDGTTSCDIGPCDTDGLINLSGVGGVDDSGFDYITGLGTIEPSREFRRLFCLSQATMADPSCWR